MGKLVLTRKVGESATLYLPDGEVLGKVIYLNNKGNKISLGFELIPEIKIARTETCHQDQLTSGSDQSHSQTESLVHAVKQNLNQTNPFTVGSSTSEQKPDSSDTSVNHVITK